MDEVPAIIHRLSLRLWVPEYRAREDQELAQSSENLEPEEAVIDPLASPPQDPVDPNGNVLDAAQIASLSLDSSAETHSLFSKKNLLQLAALNASQRTLSLFTPNMQDVVVRAWVGPMERGEVAGVASPISPTMSRKHSHVASTSTTYTFLNGSDTASQLSRPSLTSYGSSFTGSTFSTKHGKPGRKRKHRVVNLRRTTTSMDGTVSISGDSDMSATVSSATSESGFRPHADERDVGVATPPPSPHQQSQFQHSSTKSDTRRLSQSLHDTTPRPPIRDRQKAFDQPPSQIFPPTPTEHVSSASFPPPTQTRPKPLSRPNRYFQSFQPPPEKSTAKSSSSFDTSGIVTNIRNSQSGGNGSGGTPFLAAPFPYLDSNPGGILEQAWMMKMAGEIARRMQEQKERDDGADLLCDVGRRKEEAVEHSEQEEAPPQYTRLEAMG